MNTSVLVALVAALANFLQGWDNATMAGVMIHIKKEFRWEDKPRMEGLTVASSLMGATLITMCSGGISASMGRRPILMLSSVFYFVSGVLMLWTPNVYVLLFARLLDGFGIGLAITFVPMYISEMAPPEVRGLLSTLPQLTYTTGFFLSYSFVFCMSLINFSSWRLMLGLLLAPSFILYALMIFYMPESPRWLLSKGRMLEANQVLQTLRAKDDVSSEMALLVEGLEVGQTTIQQYVIGPSSELVDQEEQNPEKEEIKLLDNEGLSSMVGLRVAQESFPAAPSRHGSIVQSTFSVDPVVALMENVHEKLPEMGSKGSMILPNFGSMFSESYRSKNEEWDDTGSERPDEDYESGAASESDDNLQSPLMSRQTTSMGNTVQTQKSICKINQDASVLPSSVSIGSGWQLAWKWQGEDGPDGMKRGNFKRLYLHEAGGESVDGEFTKAAALVSQSVFLSTNQVMDKHHVGPPVVRPSSAAAGGPRLSDLLEPGVKHALLVGMGIQMLQQLLGINAVMLYTPQILEQAGVQVLLSNLGISAESSSLLISAIMTMLMLPCVVIAMRLMDVSGRRSLLLSTNPVLTTSLVTLVLVSVVDVGSTVKAIVSTASVISYGCFFSMGFGPIPSILCSEIFPTKVRGICIPICALTYWACNITVTYTLPIMLSSIGLPGVFSIFALVSLVSWAFVFFKVPETKGMPIEVIVEFFTVGAKAMQTTD